MTWLWSLGWIGLAAVLACAYVVWLVIVAFVQAIEPGEHPKE